MINKDHAALEHLIDQLVDAQNFGSDEPPSLFAEAISSKEKLDLKITLLGFALDQLKFERRLVKEPLTFDEFTQCRVAAYNNKIVFTAPEKFRNPGTGTPPIDLQPLLLLFLLIYHRHRFHVFEIIQAFVETIQDSLVYLDFKKTRTGVTRCFTNTRFAAQTLRDYGLLKFTSREAFKTWELSLTGFLVAADIFQRRSKDETPWKLLAQEKGPKLDLLPEIRKSWDQIKSYDAFVARLASLCAPDAKVFKTFEPALKKAFDLLEAYWSMLSNREVTQKERRKASLDIIRQLERDGISDGFYTEFSRCLQINKLLNGIKRP